MKKNVLISLQIHTYENRLNDDKNILKYRIIEGGENSKLYIYDFDFPVLDFLSSEDKSMMMFFYIKKRNIYFFSNKPI